MKSKIFVFLLILCVSACGSVGDGSNEDGSSLGGTETGTSDAGNIDTSTIGAKIETMTSELVPQIDNSGGGSAELERFQALAYGTSNQWSQYLLPNNIVYLTDVFGPGDENGVVTRIRVLINGFTGIIDSVFLEDPQIACDGSTALAGDDNELEIAFYGTVSNGPADDRYFDCVFVQPQVDAENSYTTIYGIDSDNTIRIVHMFDTTGANLWFPEERGNILHNLQVFYVTHNESEESETTTGYLDLQYAQASIYSGLDDDLSATADNVIFKSRTRITGKAVLDESGNPTGGNGNFVVTKYDRGVSDETSWEGTTKTVGRGNYGGGEYSLFKINSSWSSLPGVTETFCIQMPAVETDPPAYASDENCTALETTHAWGATVFPFTITPALEENFEDTSFFEANDTDLISNSGDNFSIPGYE